MLKSSCCSICLSMNKRNINIYETDLQCVYENLANFKINDDECWMCYICHKRLQQCHQLQQLVVQTRGLINEIYENKMCVEFGAYASLLELATSKTKIVSTTHPFVKQESDEETEFYYDTSVLFDESQEHTNQTEIISTTNIKQESNVKMEFCSDEEHEQDEVFENAYGLEKVPIEVEGPPDGTERRLSNVENDVHQKSKVFKLKIVELSQSVIDKCFHQSPATRPATEIYLKDSGGQTWEDHSARNAEIKKDQGRCRQDKQKTTSQSVNSSNFLCRSQSLNGSKKAKPSKRFANKGLIKNHLKLTHTGDKITSFKCDVCSKGFSQKSDLSRHVLIHTGEQPFCCNICSKKFTKTSNFKQHILTHTGIQPFSCDVCSKKFTTKSNLKKHQQLHTDERPFSCDICSKRITSKSNLLKHMRVHTGEQPYGCDICSKKFTTKGNFTQHQLSHTGEQSFCCEICSRKFTTKSNLKKHQLIHTGEQPFSCDDCSKRFTSKSNLKKHELIHTGEKPFGCDSCAKRFTQKSQLNSHVMLIHSSNKRFSCDICLKKFRKMNNWKQHLLIHKGTKPSTFSY